MSIMPQKKKKKKNSNTSIGTYSIAKRKNN